MPLNTVRFSRDAAEWFAEIKYIGRWAFFGMAWIVEQLGGHPWLFKLVIVAISCLGAFVVLRYSPFTRPQSVLLAFGYYPFYEYGTILRDYSIVWTATVGCCALLAGTRWRPLAFCAVLAVLFQTNPFGLGLACALGSAFVFDSWRAGQLTVHGLRRPSVWCGALVAIASFLIAFKSMTPPPEIAEIVLGGPLRSDSHLVRLQESLAFPFRAWFPIPLFGGWNSQILDAWPWIQIALGAIVASLVIAVVRTEATALVLFSMGMLGIGAILCHMPGTALRYHGPYFLLLVCAYWIKEKRRPDLPTPGDVWPLFRWIDANRACLFTGLLWVHAIVGCVFLCQEQVVPFSGARQAAEIIRSNEPPDVAIVGDPDYGMISLCGYLDRPVFIASRREPGAFTRVDKKRRGTLLSAEELSQVVGDKLREERRDIVLVTIYPVSMPREIGTLLGVTNSITDERYHIYRIRYRSAVE